MAWVRVPLSAPLLVIKSISYLYFGVIHIFRDDILFSNLLKLTQEKIFGFSLRYQEVKDPYTLSRKKINEQINSEQSDNEDVHPTADEIFKPFSIQLNKDEELKERLKEEISELKSVYKLSIETRNFEISNLIHRNNFFMLFQGVLLAAVFSNQASKPFVESTICCMGIFISWHQIKVAAGAKYWQEWWEVRTSDIELTLKIKMEKLTGSNESFISLFDFSETKSKSDTEKKVIAKTYKKPLYTTKAPELFENISKTLISGRYSVSRVPISSGIILLITWLVLFLGTLGLTESVMNTSSKYELCIRECNSKSDIPAMLKDGWNDFKLINGHFFTDNEDPPTQLIFNQYNQEKPR